MDRSFFLAVYVGLKILTHPMGVEGENGQWQFGNESSDENWFST